MSVRKRNINLSVDELAFMRAAGKRFRFRRKRAGLTQGQLGDLIGSNATQISLFENGLGLLDVAKFAKACIVFGCSADSILGLDQIKGVVNVRKKSN